MAYSIDENCTSCGDCVSSCPVDAIHEGKPYFIDAEVCTDCGQCIDTCPVEAIHEG